ncbi:hypothetical protein [Desertihabitans aurantiacus]|nr:hypothetical protein [Desertihabitans aurantiacus]
MSEALAGEVADFGTDEHAYATPKVQTLREPLDADRDVAPATGFPAA